MSSSTQASPEREVASNGVLESESCEKMEKNEEENVPTEPVKVEMDVLGYFSLWFHKSKDVNDRKVRLDFTDGSQRRRSLTRVRYLGKGDAPPPSQAEGFIVSFQSQDDAEDALKESSGLKAKYPDLAPAHPFQVCPDKDGAFSIEFINSGMSGIREITNEFSKHGEVVKVMAGGAKNAIKKVTVSYAEKNAALEAVKAHANSKDYISIDFAKECIEWTTK